MGNTRNSPNTEAVRAAIGASLARHVSPGMHVVVALSGGVDSMALLHCLSDELPRHGVTLAALHVHHNLSANADAWATHCQEVCTALAVPMEVRQVEVERGSADGLEAAARRARHAAFATVTADRVALGHHRDDQAETMLFNLLRGTGLRGAAAMAQLNGRLWRPLLEIGRDTIDACAREIGLRWIVDESNADTRFARNHLRHEILANLEQRFPGSQSNLAAASRRFAEALQLLDELALLDLGDAPPDFPLALACLAALSEARGRNVLRYLLQKHQVGIPSEEKLREALRQLLHAAPDRHPEIILGRHVLRRSGRRICLSAIQ